MRRWKTLTAISALFLVIGAAPALGVESVDETEPADATEEATDEGAGVINGKFMILFAEGFDVDEEALVALRELHLGFGDIFKLNVYASVLGVTIEELLAGAELDPATGEYEFDWGALRDTLSPEQLALFDEMPRNFGQMVSEDKRHHGRDEHRPASTNDSDEHPGRGLGLLEEDASGERGRPDHTGRRGRGASNG